MKRAILLTILLLTGVLALSAATVTYDTSLGSVFNCSNTASLKGCGTNQIVVGGADGVTLYYLPVSTSVFATPTSIANFGSIIAACTAGGTVCGGQTLPTGLTLTIQFNQAAPDAGLQSSLTGAISGAIGGSFSLANIAWAPGSAVVLTGPTYTVTYSILNPTLYWVPPANNNCPNPCPVASPAGNTTIQGLITDPPNTVPEPSTMILIGTGAIAAGAFRKKWMAATAS